MANIPIIIIYEVKAERSIADLKAEEKKHEDRLNEAVDEILAFIENCQIKAYTSSGNPPLPTGSRYQRTFNLRAASHVERTGTKLPNISGEWSVDEGKARYGRYVLGSRSEQAKIHRGRWKTRPEVEKETQEKAPQIVKEKLRQ